jgi:hypothetical protein
MTANRITFIAVEYGCAMPFFWGTSQLLKGNVYLFIHLYDNII